MKQKQHVKLFEAYHSLSNLKHIGLSKRHTNISASILLKLVKGYSKNGKGRIVISKAIIGPRLVYAGRKRGNQPILHADRWHVPVNVFIKYLESVIDYGVNSQIYVNGTLSYDSRDTNYEDLVSNCSFNPNKWTYRTPNSEKFLEDIRRGVYNDYDDYSDGANDYSDNANDYDDYSDNASDYDDYSDNASDANDYSDDYDDYSDNANDYSDYSDGYDDYSDNASDYDDYSDYSDDYNDYSN